MQVVQEKSYTCEQLLREMLNLTGGLTSIIDEGKLML